MPPFHRPVFDFAEETLFHRCRDAFNLRRVDENDILKLALILFLFSIVGPFLGLLIKNRPTIQKYVFAAMVFMTISGFLKPAEWGLTILFDPNYSGHARGFHFFFNEVPAIALIVARFLEAPRSFRWLPPGLMLYLLYIAASALSLVNAPDKIFFAMAALKSVKVTLIFLAGYQFLKGDEELHFFFKTMSITALWECVVVLKMKYLNGLYQVSGTFEHQNSLSMYFTMLGMLLLALGSAARHKNSYWYLAGFLACAITVQSTLSRAGLVIFAAGTTGVLLLGLIDKITVRRVAVMTALAIIGAIGLAFTLDTILKRFNDQYNEASNFTRIDLNNASRAMLRDHALGVGWNNYGITINHPYKYGDVIEERSRKFGEIIDKKHKKGISESHYFLLLAETGYPGFAAYLIFIGGFLWFNFRAFLKFRSQWWSAISLGLAMGCLTNYLQSFLERVLTQPRNMMLWMLLLATASRIELWRRKKRLEEKAAIQNSKISPPQCGKPPDKSPGFDVKGTVARQDPMGVRTQPTMQLKKTSPSP